MNPVKNLRRILDTALGLVYPENCCLTGQAIEPCKGFWVDEAEIAKVRPLCYPLCLRCGRPYKGAMENPSRCANCAKLPLHFDTARAYARTTGVVREVIHRFKYSQSLWLRNLLGHWLGLGYDIHYADQHFDHIVPVPLHPRKWRERGFNQSLVLGELLSEQTGIALADILQRDRDSTTQTTFNRQKRFTNLANSFKLSPKAKVRDLSLLLVDDVLTTGATASECARILKKAGARNVGVLTVARG